MAYLVWDIGTFSFEILKPLPSFVYDFMKIPLNWSRKGYNLLLRNLLPFWWPLFKNILIISCWVVPLKIFGESTERRKFVWFCVHGIIEALSCKYYCRKTSSLLIYTPVFDNFKFQTIDYLAFVYLQMLDITCWISRFNIRGLSLFFSSSNPLSLLNNSVINFSQSYSLSLLFWVNTPSWFTNWCCILFFKLIPNNTNN